MNIWTFKENDEKEYNEADLTKQFKPTAKIHDDLETVCRIMGTRMHPAFRALKPPPPREDGETGEPPEKAKEITTLTFSKHRIDRNSMKALFLVLPHAPTLHTLK